MSHDTVWDFKFSRRRVWCSELSSGIYCRVKWLSTDVSFIPDDGGSTHLWNVGRQSFTRQYISEDNSENHMTLFEKHCFGQPFHDNVPEHCWGFFWFMCSLFIIAVSVLLFYYYIMYYIVCIPCSRDLEAGPSFRNKNPIYKVCHFIQFFAVRCVGFTAFKKELDLPFFTFQNTVRKYKWIKQKQNGYF
jgi:hypothetical protein